MSASGDDLAVIIQAVFKVVEIGAACLIGILTHLASEIRRDVRDMKLKVGIMWDRYERSGVVVGAGAYRASASPNVVERI